jgi:prenylcysteine oxidase/farnesylcysteine lyase
MESFISTMETSALMGMNVAQLIVDDFQQLKEDQSGAESGIGEQKVIMQAKVEI